MCVCNVCVVVVVVCACKVVFAVVYVLRVCGMCVSCFGGVLCCAVSLCVVLVLVLVCNVWCVVSVVCVRGVCGCVLSVCNAAGHAENPPHVPAKRPHVEHMRAFRRYTRKRFEPTHGDVLNQHTGSASLSLSSFSLPSFFLLSFSHSLSLLSCLLSLLSQRNNDNDHSFSRLSLYTFPVWRTCSHHERNNCPGITVQASCHLE